MHVHQELMLEEVLVSFDKMILWCAEYLRTSRGEKLQATKDLGVARALAENLRKTIGR